jgi:hypothetical protein
MKTRLRAILLATVLTVPGGCVMQSSPDTDPSNMPAVIDPTPAPGGAMLTTAGVQAVRAAIDDPVAATRLTVVQMLEETREGITEVAADLPPAQADPRATADSLAAGIDYMLAAWTPGDRLPEAYVEDLARNVQLLRIARTTDDPDDAYLLFSAVAEDMAIKVEHCRALGIGLGGLVAVRAHTLRDASTDAGWQVVYLRKLLESLPGAEPQPFPRLSSPSEDSLAPGRYWVWARRPGTPEQSERMLLTVGAGRTSMDVDIPLPPRRQ